MLVEALITGIAGVLGGGLITHLFHNKKYKAEVKVSNATADVTIASEALKLVSALQSELALVKAEVYELRRDNVELHKQVAQLTGEKVELQDRIDQLEKGATIK